MGVKGVGAAIGACRESARLVEPAGLVGQRENLSGGCRGSVGGAAHITALWLALDPCSACSQKVKARHDEAPPSDDRVGQPHRIWVPADAACMR